jgi:hypothetical protein
VVGCSESWKIIYGLASLIEKPSFEQEERFCFTDIIDKLNLDKEVDVIVVNRL